MAVMMGAEKAESHLLKNASQVISATWLHLNCRMWTQRQARKNRRPEELIH